MMGPYVLLGVIGEGSSGLIYRARHQETGECCALKHMMKIEVEQLSSVRREISVLRRLKHPGIVRIFDDGLEKGRPWMAMELLEGSTLRHLLEHHVGDSIVSGYEQILEVMIELLRTLAFLHAQGVFHGDLKPENVMIGPTGGPVLIDFGLASSFVGVGSLLDGSESAYEVAGCLTGTLMYTAPEQMEGRGDARSDLYALGCILYEWLTGQAPFAGDSAQEIIEKQRLCVPPPPSVCRKEIPSEFDELCLQLLDKEPRCRPAYARDLLSRLELLRTSLFRGECDVGAAPEALKLEDFVAKGLYLYRSCMVGRTEELREGERFVQRLSAYHRHFLFVGGESGIGKTRLAMEISRVAVRSGVRVISSRCSAQTRVASEGESSLGHSPDALGAFLPALRSIVGLCLAQESGCAADFWTHAVPWLSLLAVYEPALSRLPGVSPSIQNESLPPQIARYRLYVALGQVLSLFAKRRTTLLFVDDLQWMDELSLGFLSFLHGAAPSSFPGIHILGTYRSEELPMELRPLFDSLEVQELLLFPLDESKISLMVSELLSTDCPPPALVRSLVDDSGGNPFFVSEYLQMAIQQGLMSRDLQGVWRLEGGEEGVLKLPLPGSLRALMSRRFEQLSPLARAMAGAIASAGQLVEFVDFEALLSLDEDDYLQALEELSLKRLIEERAPELFTFTHHQLGAFAYQDIEDGRKISLHRALALQLEALREESQESMLAEIGHHWLCGGDSLRGRGYMLGGASRARKRYAYKEAERLFRLCLELSDVENAEDVEIHLELGNDIYYMTGQNEEAMLQFEQALACSQRLGLRGGEGRSLFGRARVFAKNGRLEEASMSCERALVCLREVGDPEAEGDVLNLVGVLHCFQGRLEDGFACYERALVLHEQTGNMRGQAVSLGNMAIVQKSTDRLDEALRSYLAAIEVARAANLRREEAINLGNLVGVLTQTGRWDEGLEMSMQAVEILREVGDRNQEGIYLCSLLHMKRLMGCPMDELIGLAEQTEQLLREISDPLYLSYSLCEKGHLQIMQGQTARHLLDEALEIALKVGVKPDNLHDCGQALTRLQNAQQAFELGRGLFRGDDPGSLTPETRRYFLEKGDLSPALL